MRNLMQIVLSGLFFATLPLSLRAENKSDGPYALVVMDPLTLPLSCP